MAYTTETELRQPSMGAEGLRTMPAGMRGVGLGSLSGADAGVQGLLNFQILAYGIGAVMILWAITQMGRR